MAAGDGVASVTYTLDGQKTTATGAAKDVSLSADGVHTLAYFATDKAGNASAAKSLVVRVDRTPPGVAIGSPVAGAAHVVGTSVTALTAAPTAARAWSAATDRRAPALHSTREPPAPAPLR